MSRSADSLLGTNLWTLLWAAAFVACDPAPQSAVDAWHGVATVPRPANLLVLTIDTLRADALGAYGNTGGHTPVIDALAAQGVVFENAYAPIATTFPSHASLFTGVYPRLHGVRWNGHNLDDDWTTLAEVLDDRGYETGAFVSYQAMVNRGGLGQGFDDRSDPEPAKWSGSRPGNETVDMAQEWLGQLNDSDPFFLWVHLFEPHSPYPLTDYAVEAMEGYSGFFSEGITAEGIHNLPKGWADDPREPAALRALYDGRVRDADAQAGRLLAALEQAGRLDDTLIVVLGDHGQLLGEHGKAGHGPLLFEEVLRVPLVIHDPTMDSLGTGESTSGVRVADRVGLIDVMPTVLERLGESVPDGLQGRSLAQAMAGERLPMRPYFVEVRVPQPEKHAEPDDQVDGSVGVFQGRYKLVVKGKQRKLYDLAADPQELHSLTAENKDLVRELEALVFRHQQIKQLLDSAAEGDLDPEAIAELKALGYL